MPRRNGNAEPAKRGPYKPDKREELERLDLKRKRAGVTVDELADRAGVDRRTFQRIRRTGLIFPRTLIALRMALRALEKERKAAAELFPSGGDA